MPSRRFTEKQTAEIMRRAAEIQAQGAASPVGVSEDELRAAARELGIQGEALDAALASLEAPEAARTGLWGGPFRREVDIVFEGQITDERWEEVLADLRRTFGETGQVDRRGNTYEWSGTGGGVDNNTVTVRQSGSAVRLSLTAEYSGLGVLAYLLSAIPMFVGVAVVAKTAPPAPWGGLALAAWAVGLLLSARTCGAWLSRRRGARLRSLAERLRAALSDDAGLRDRLAAGSKGAEAAATDVEAQT